MFWNARLRHARHAIVPGHDKGGRVNATGQRRRVRCGTWPSRRVGRCRDAQQQRRQQQQQQQQHLRCGSAPLAASRPSSRPRSPSSYHSPPPRHLHAARRYPTHRAGCCSRGMILRIPSPSPQSPLGDPKTKPARARRCSPTDRVTRPGILVRASAIRKLARHHLWRSLPTHLGITLSRARRFLNVLTRAVRLGRLFVYLVHAAPNVARDQPRLSRSLFKHSSNAAIIPRATRTVNTPAVLTLPNVSTRSTGQRMIERRTRCRRVACYHDAYGASGKQQNTKLHEGARVTEERRPRRRSSRLSSAAVEDAAWRVAGRGGRGGSDARQSDERARRRGDKIVGPPFGWWNEGKRGAGRGGNLMHDARENEGGGEGCHVSARRPASTQTDVVPTSRVMCLANLVPNPFEDFGNSRAQAVCSSTRERSLITLIWNFGEWKMSRKYRAAARVRVGN